jgi:GT2 family glycosyltransferase
LDLQMIRHVSIIVLCWNRWDLTSRCLESIHRCTDLTNVDVIAVDNGSEDETPAKLQKIGWVRVVRSEINLGFVRGNNLALELTDPSSDVLLLNNDTEILESGWIERLQEAAHAAPDVGIVGCRLLHRDGVLSCAGAYLVPDTCRGHFIGVWEKDVGQYPLDRDVPTVIFAAAYIRREVLASIGNLSEAYESYFEDTDYCLRAREAGFRVICCGRVSILHHVAGSTEGRSDLLGDLFERSWRTFRNLWQKKLVANYRYNVDWHSIASLATHRGGHDRTIVRALDGLGIRMAYSQDLSRLPPTVPPPPEIFDPYLHALATREHAESAISVVLGPADALDRGAGAYRIGFAAPGHQAHAIERLCKAKEIDEVWVATASERDALLRLGLAQPVHAMPLGVDTDYFHPAARAFRNPSGDFVFLAFFEWPHRNTPEILLRAFNETFGDRESVALVCIVTTPELGFDITDEIAALGLRPRGGRIRLLLNRAIPYYQLPMLYRSTDCYVSLNSAERWGLDLLEAMACGLPVIATEAAARTVDLSIHADYQLQCHRAVSNSLESTTVSADPVPDLDHLSSLLRNAFEHRNAAAEVGRLAVPRIHAEFSLAQSVRRIKTRLDEIAANRHFTQTAVTRGPTTSSARPTA